MNEQDLKEMIRSLLSEMDTDTVTELKKEEQKQDSEFKSLEKMVFNLIKKKRLLKMELFQI